MNIRQPYDRRRYEGRRVEFRESIYFIATVVLGIFTYVLLATQ